MFERLPIQVDSASRSPIYDQIEAQIKSLIVGGQLPPGSALPSIRKLATQLSCSVITTRRAYQNLEQAGYIETLQGKGTFVKAMSAREQAMQKHVSLEEALKKAIEAGRRYGYSDDELKKLFAEALMEG
ncbi:GntR family transcriptional regulator [Bacillus sp. FSL W7-1360]